MRAVCTPSCGRTDVDGADARYQVDGRTQRLLNPGQLALVLLDMTSLPALALIDGWALAAPGSWVTVRAHVICWTNPTAHHRATRA